MNPSLVYRFTLAVLAGLLLAACETVGVATPDQIGATLVKICRTQEEAWNRGDLDSFMSAGYMRSDKLTFYSGGNVALGYDAMLTHYKARYQSEGKEMGHLAFSDLDPLALDNAHAVMRGRWRLTFEKQPPLGGLFTLVFVHTSHGWRIIHDHTSIETRAPAEKSS